MTEKRFDTRELELDSRAIDAMVEGEKASAEHQRFVLEAAARLAVAARVGGESAASDGERSAVVSPPQASSPSELNPSRTDLGGPSPAGEDLGPREQPSVQAIGAAASMAPVRPGEPVLRDPGDWVESAPSVAKRSLVGIGIVLAAAVLLAVVVVLAMPRFNTPSQPSTPTERAERSPPIPTQSLATTETAVVGPTSTASVAPHASAAPSALPAPSSQKIKTKPNPTTTNEPIFDFPPEDRKHHP